MEFEDDNDNGEDYMTIDWFYEIETEVKGAIGEAFCKAIKRNESDFILLMARGGYHKHLDREDIDLSPFVVEDRMDFLMDLTRRRFFVRFMNDYVEKLNAGKVESDEERRLHQ